MNDPVLWIAIGGSVLFFAVLLWKGLWLLRMIATDPADGEVDQEGERVGVERAGVKGGNKAGLRSAATDSLGGKSHGDQNN